MDNKIKDLARDFIQNAKQNVNNSRETGEAVKPEPIPAALRKFSITTPILEKIEQLPEEQRSCWLPIFSMK